ncbi:MAG: class I SAM-dependent methyltransferase [Nitrospirae bacterium]|nr:MAG: class I SAM-dependent methyltransferase [Nitrospirota bacterium]
MNLTTLKGGIPFWDRFAPWYEKWAARGEYHRPLVKELSSMVEPGWKVLDIGAATGTLSIPLNSVGCAVHALEPSEGMLKILYEKIGALSITGIECINERWEDFTPSHRYDLLLASNSLHLTDGGIMCGMKKVFSTLPAYVCLVTEINQQGYIDFKDIDRLQNHYDFLYIRNYRLNSSFIFQDMEEAEIVSAILGRELSLTRMGDVIVEPSGTDVAVLWWERTA